MDDFNKLIDERLNDEIRTISELINRGISDPMTRAKLYAAIMVFGANSFALGRDITTRIKVVAMPIPLEIREAVESLLSGYECPCETCQQRRAAASN